MQITILTSYTHPAFSYLENWKKENSTKHSINIVEKLEDIKSGDILFIISFLKLVPVEIRNKFKHSLVIHASDLPKGRGWSPYIWDILNGSNKITLTLFEAVDEIDAGKIWTKKTFDLEGHELYDEINEKLFKTELEVMDFAIENKDKIIPAEQNNSESTYNEKRTPEDSKLDPNQSIAEQFELLRVADPNRFPCFFDFRGHRYKLFLQK